MEIIEETDLGRVERIGETELGRVERKGKQRWDGLREYEKHKLRRVKRI